MLIFMKLGPVLFNALFVILFSTRSTLSIFQPSSTMAGCWVFACCYIIRQTLLLVIFRKSQFMHMHTSSTSEPSLVNHKRHNLLLTPATYYWFQAVPYIHKTPLYITVNLCILCMQIRIIVSYLLLWFVDWFSFHSIHAIQPFVQFSGS